MLEFCDYDNTWQPPEIDENEIAAAFTAGIRNRQSDEYLYVFQSEPFIDSLFIEYDADGGISLIRRFAIHDGYVWPRDDEDFFHERCIRNLRCACPGGRIDEIFRLYKAGHPEWHLKRYYTKSPRLLDHIYNCLKKNTAKEMLYKSGLDEYAAHIDDLDELNLFAVRPSEIYDGLTMRVLRSLNCREGVELVNRHDYRIYLKDLSNKFPKLFSVKYKDMQCRYLRRLIDGELTVGETGRLFGTRCGSFVNVCSDVLYDAIIAKEQNELQVMKLSKLFGKMDPIYEDYIKKAVSVKDDWRLQRLNYLLLTKKDEYDALIRRSNRKRSDDWQERGDVYYIRYPQTINDFCREAIYMQNCLMEYIDALVNNDTTILFMRKIDDPNTPYITIEIYDNTLMQAYHRFNRDCDEEEASWINEYCQRHDIKTDKFTFDNEIDELF